MAQLLISPPGAKDEWSVMAAKISVMAAKKDSPHRFDQYCHSSGVLLDNSPTQPQGD
jgi:hypothetical protein